MPFGLPSVSSAYQRNMRRILMAQESRHHAVLAEMDTVLQEPPEPPEPPEAQGSVAHEEPFLQRAASAAPTLLRRQNQVTFSKFVSWERPSGCIIPRPRGSVPVVCILFLCL